MIALLDYSLARPTGDCLHFHGGPRPTSRKTEPSAESALRKPGGVSAKSQGYTSQSNGCGAFPPSHSFSFGIRTQRKGERALSNGPRPHPPGFPKPHGHVGAQHVAVIEMPTGAGELVESPCIPDALEHKLPQGEEALPPPPA